MTTDNGTLVVEWDSGIEFIVLADVLNGACDAKLATKEWRIDNTQAHYVAHLSRTSNTTFNLEYREEEGQQPDCVYGIATYTISGDREVTGTWKPQKEREETQVLKCRIEEQEVQERVRRLVERAVRDRKFREKIMAADKGKCVITSEAIPHVLEAAHVFGVGGGGSDGNDNGFILRKDLHALFDANLFWICHSCGKFNLDPSVPESYRKIFERKLFLDGAFDRVKRNIEKRNLGKPCVCPGCIPK